MPARVSPTEQIRASIDELFADPDRDLGATMEDVARLSVRLVFQAALEAEVTEFLGRDRYARGERDREGLRNGYSEVTVKTTAGPVELKRPKVRGTLEAFSSRLLGKGVTRTNALEALVISGWVRGLSVRDIEAALAETLGPDAAVSKSTVSEICKAIQAQFEQFKRRDLSGVDLAYLYVDASHFRYHHAADAEPVLVAYGITTDGDPVLLAVDGAAAESHDACAGFLSDLVARGLRPPLLTVSDGGPGLIGAIDRILPTSLRQRCLVHRSWNALAKVSAADAAEFKADFWAVFDDVDADPGEAAVAQARRHADELASKWDRRYPGAVACVTDDLDHLVAHLRCPKAHWRRIRHTNLIERTFGETRRRVKVMGRLPGERSCLSLVWAVLDRATAGWRGVTVTPADSRLLAGLRARLEPDTAPGVPGAPSGAGQAAVAGDVAPAALGDLPGADGHAVIAERSAA